MQNFLKKYTLKSSVLFGSVLFGLLILLVVYTAFHFFDFSDEGYLLYLQRAGISGRFLSPFYLLTHYIGVIFNHQLIGYRLLNIGSSFLATFWIFWSIKNNVVTKSGRYLVGLTLGFLTLSSVSLIQTFSYNNLAFIGTALWIGALYRSYKAPGFYLGALMALGTSLTFYARPPAGVVLGLLSILVLTYLYFVAQKPIKKMASGASIISLLVLAISCAFWPVWGSLFVLYKAQSTVSHSGWLMTSLSQGTEFFIIQVVLALGIWWWGIRKANDEKKQKTAALLVALWAGIVIHQGFIRFGESELRHMLGVMFAIVGVMYSLVKFRKIQSHLFLLTFLVALVASLGTNVGLMSHTLQYMLPIFSIPFLMIVIKLTKGFRCHQGFGLTAIGLIWVTMSVTTVHNLVIDHYRTASFPAQTTYLTAPSFLKNIRIEASLARNMQAFYDVLNQVQFDPTQDRIFAYPDLPGFVAAFPIYSYGSVWNATGYPNHITAIAAYIDLEPLGQPIRYVYLLKGNQFEEEITKMLAGYLIPKTADFLEIEIGETGRHYRNQNTYKLTFEGPYKLK